MFVLLHYVSLHRIVVLSTRTYVCTIEDHFPIHLSLTLIQNVVISVAGGPKQSTGVPY